MTRVASLDWLVGDIVADDNQVDPDGSNEAVKDG